MSGRQVGTTQLLTGFQKRMKGVEDGLNELFEDLKDEVDLIRVGNMPCQLRRNGYEDGLVARAEEARTCTSSGLYNLPQYL